MWKTARWLSADDTRTFLISVHIYLAVEVSQ